MHNNISPYALKHTAALLLVVGLGMVQCKCQPASLHMQEPHSIQPSGSTPAQLNVISDLMIQEALQKEYRFIAEVLSKLQKGEKADDFTQCQALDEAIEAGNLCMVMTLYRPEDKRNELWLRSAASQPNVEILEFFLTRHKTAINAKDKSGNTALHFASKSGLSKNIKLLTEHGANVHAKNKKGRTPLHHAARSDSPESVELLASNGAPLEARDKQGMTPLHYAVEQEHPATVAMLADKGAHLDTGDPFRNTSLGQAINQSNIEIVRLLLDKGANIKGQVGALIVAIEQGNLDIIHLLLDRGATISLPVGGIPSQHLLNSTAYQKKQ